MQKVKELKELMLPVGNATRAGAAQGKSNLCRFRLFFQFLLF